MLVVTISGGRAKGKSTLMRSVSALLTKMVPGIRVYTHESDSALPLEGYDKTVNPWRAKKDAPPPHVLLQTVTTAGASVEPRDLGTAVKVAQEIASRIVNPFGGSKVKVNLPDEFLGVDYAKVEARVLAWMNEDGIALSDEDRKLITEWVVAMGEPRNSQDLIDHIRKGEWGARWPARNPQTSNPPRGSEIRLTSNTIANLNDRDAAMDRAILHFNAPDCKTDETWTDQVTGLRFIYDSSHTVRRVDGLPLSEAARLIDESILAGLKSKGYTYEEAVHRMDNRLSAQTKDWMDRQQFDSRIHRSKRYDFADIAQMYADVDRYWKRVRLNMDTNPIWLEIPRPMPEDINMTPILGTIPLYNGELPYAKGYGYSGSAEPPATAPWIDYSDGQGIRLNPCMKPKLPPVSDGTASLTDPCYACDGTKGNHDEDCPVKIMQTICDQSNKAYNDLIATGVHESIARKVLITDYDLKTPLSERTYMGVPVKDYIKPTIQPDDDQATHDAIVREIDDDESYAEREVEKGRAKRLWMTYQPTVGPCLNAIKEYSADGQGQALAQQWAQVKKDADIGGFYIIYAIKNLVEPGYLFRSLIRDYTRLNNPPSDLVNHTWKSDIPSGAYRAPVPKPDVPGEGYSHIQHFATPHGAEMVVPVNKFPHLKNLSDQYNAGATVHLEDDETPDWKTVLAQPGLSYGDKLAQAVQMLRNEASLGRATKLRESLGFSMLVKAWDDYVEANPHARLDGPAMNKIRKAAKRH